MSARLTTDFWVSAYRARLAQANIPVFVTAKGDTTSGAVLVKLNTLDGNAKLFQRQYDLLTDQRSWQTIGEGGEDEVDASIRRQRSFDSDLWVIEVEDRDGRHLLDDEGLAT